MAEGGKDEKYLHFVKRLQEDREVILKDVNTIFEEVKEYETLQLAINKIKALKTEKLKTMVNIGKNIFCEAKIDGCQRIVVKLAGDLFAELTLDRAEEYIEKRIALLNEIATRLEKKAYDIQARGHLTLFYLGQFDQFRDSSSTDDRSSSNLANNVAPLLQ